MKLGEQPHKEVLIRRNLTRVKASMCEILGGISLIYLDVWEWRQEIERQYDRLDKMRL